MKQLIFILTLLIFASCNNEGPEDKVLTTNTIQVVPTPTPPPIVEKFTKKFEFNSYGTQVYYFNEMGMSYMITFNNEGRTETINFTIDSLRAEWFKNQLKK